MPGSIAQRLVLAFADAMDPLADVDSERLRAWCQSIELGVDPAVFESPELGANAVALASSAARTRLEAEALAKALELGSSNSADLAEGTLSSADETITRLRALDAQLGAFSDLALDYLLAQYVENHFPITAAIMTFIGGIDRVPQSARRDPRAPDVRRKLSWENLWSALFSPLAHFKSVFGLNASSYDGTALFDRIGDSLANSPFSARIETGADGKPRLVSEFFAVSAVSGVKRGAALHLLSVIEPIQLDLLSSGGEWLTRISSTVRMPEGAGIRFFESGDIDVTMPPGGKGGQLTVEVTARPPGEGWFLIAGGAIPSVRLEGASVSGRLGFVPARVAGDWTIEPTVNVKLLGLDVDLGDIAPILGAVGEGRTSNTVYDVAGSWSIVDGFAFEIVRRGSSAGGTDSFRFKALHLNRKCLVLSWREPNIGRWLQNVNPHLKDESPPLESDVSLRAVFGGKDWIRELRLDCTLRGMSRTLSLPGFKVQLPEQVQLSLLVGAGGAGFKHIALALTFDPSSKLVAKSSFAWESGTGREAQNDAARASDEPLLQLTLRAREKVTLVLLNFVLGEDKLPHFLQQLEVPLSALDFAHPETLSDPAPWSLKSLKASSWDVEFKLNVERAAFIFPFLNKQGGESSTSQFIKVEPDLKAVSVNILSHSIDVPLKVTLTIGALVLEMICEMVFNWETFAFKITHEEGLKLFSPEPIITPPDEHLGLRWRFKGVPVAGPDGKTRFHYFTLATKDSNYQVLQAPGAAFELEYSQLSDEAIGFAISNFALTSSGLSLAATVIDRPAKLNGIDTRFRFSGSQLVIKDNRITDFTLMGSGPLPPALVGDATAEVALQMAQRNGKLTLVAGAARLKGPKLLDCKGTRFQFSIEAIGLKFVYEGRYHLYFTLTGSAQFTPRAGDDKDAALALLSRVKIDLVECPLVGDARILARHVRFLVDLPKPLSFNFLGAFEMELRGIGFVPQVEAFAGDPSMLVTGQLKFAQGEGDTPDPRTDLHKLYIGLPKKGSIAPRIHFEDLPVHLNLGSVFRLNGVVDFIDHPLEKGFSGEGTLEIQGLPGFAAAFAFVRVRQDDNSPWMRAWFIYLEARKVSFRIPFVELFIREVGLGFGYRYTLASIRAADESNDVRKLLQELKLLSRTQGDLSKRDRWAIDLESAGKNPRWTVVLRAMISQTSAQTSPLRYDEKAERDLPSLFLFDTVIALRSDLTFLMAARGWLFANYYDYVTDFKGMREKPLLSGFVLLSPRQKRLLANVSSNPGGQFGNHPPMPEFVQRALSKAQFSATMLVEPGLFHTELGWPNQLRWSDKLGPLEAEFRGGFIFRVSRDELVNGVSFLARSKLEIKADLDLRVVGVRVSALASVSFGGRYIGLLSLKDPLGSSALYAGVGLEVMIRFSIELWLRLRIGFIKISKSFRFSFTLDFTAGLELGLSSKGAGLRGNGHLAVSVMGHRFALSVKFGFNEDAVQRAFDHTKRVLQQGLEATDVEPLPPGLQGAGLTAGRARLLAAATPVLAFHAPEYSLFVIWGETEDDWSHFVLLPAGERRRQDGSGHEVECGFLPAPPPEGKTPPSDFLLRLTKAAEETYSLEQYTSATNTWVSRVTPAAQGALSIEWGVHWDAPLVTGEQGVQYPLDKEGEPTGEAAPRAFTLREYLRNAFVVRETDSPAGGEPQVVPEGDPTSLPGARNVEDERVRNPTDSAFEAAVRGAMEQFRGSPFFRRDPSSEYEQLLERAYRNNTTIYAANGQVPTDPELQAQVQRHQQAHELRGLVVHDMVADLRAYVAAADKSNQQLTLGSLAFAMGLVFRLKGKKPLWLKDLVASGGPTLAQRLGPQASAPVAADAQPVRTFNIRSTDFASHPPQFERVQQLTDASTIAIAWDLVWPQAPHEEATPGQRDPEHHLLHYRIRRRALSGNDREVVYTLKGADTLHRAESGVLSRLRRRFQLVDHFAEETAEDLIALPVTGKSYFYSITPIDFAGNVGRPLSLVATRFPSQPPAVPVNGECIVRYGMSAQTLHPDAALSPEAPALIVPSGLRVEWTEPPISQQEPSVPIATYQLVFRREPILPVGSYGLDSSTQRPATKSLPTSNARPLPTDVKILLGAQGTSDARFAELATSALQAAGVIPAGVNPAWRPEAWRVFFQTISQNGVPSALAPVQLLLRVEPVVKTPSGLTFVASGREERRPAELEWLPHPMRFSFLPAEDQQARVGSAHVPMPTVQRSQPVHIGLRFNASLDNVRHVAHPGGLRCIRIRWNQGPSGSAAYPLDLNAGYKLLELDVDAHTAETFGSAQKLGAVLRPIQDVQMIPADELALTPADTLVPIQWEAWYPSTIQRRREPSERAEGSELPFAPWYSWRESFLRWPAWPGLTTEPGARDTALHPALQKIVEVLSANYWLEPQASPATQPGNLAAFFKATAPSADPHGWGVLQRFGLSMAFRLRTSGSGELVTGAALLAAVDKALSDASASLNTLWDHLHVELLFQPGRAVELESMSASPEALVALVQLSLRPVIFQRRFYARLSLEGQSGSSVDLTLNLAAGTSCSLVDQGDPASGQIELVAGAQEGSAIKRTVRFPVGGRTALLFRAPQPNNGLPSLPRIGVPLRAPLAQPADLETDFGGHFRYVDVPAPQVVVMAPLEAPTPAQRARLLAFLGPDNARLLDLLLSVRLKPFNATDELVNYFSVDAAGLAAAFVADEEAGPAWAAFRSYAQSLASTDPVLPEDQKIRVPATRVEIEALLPDFTAWAQRFFDCCGAMEKSALAHVAIPGTKPWMATAYPRSGAPVHVAPDASGRLQYDHLIEDPWAHNYRYYVRPYGRYDRLWQSLRESTALFFPQTPRLEEPLPDPSVGGLDVVLERTRAVAKPLVLSSMRLDPPSTPASPAVPGTTWEVLVAEHPEQTLIEHNQTLARQLAFRQVAYTLLRTFAHAPWLKQLGEATTPPGPIELELVTENYPVPPSTYPTAPEHLDLSATLEDAAARTLDLPARISAFQQGAMALQWEGMPFYYEHRLLLVAQSASTVSPINEVVQRDFEYRTPEPQAEMGPVRGNWTPAPPFGDSSTPPLEVSSRGVDVPLCRLWDSLPKRTQDRWASEKPDGVSRKPGWLPDLGVVYQLVELYQGNIEVQAEVFFDETSRRFTRRQLGSRFLVDPGALTAPADAAGRFSLKLLVQQITQQELSRPYGDADRQRLAPGTRGKVSFSGRLLSFVGVMTPADRDNLLAVVDPPDARAIQKLHDAWYAQEPISEAPASLPGGFKSQVEFPEPTGVRLVWDGPLSAAEHTALLALPGDAEFVAALGRLASAAGTGRGVSSIVAPLGPEQIPTALLGRVTLAVDPPAGRYTQLRWVGNLSDADAEALARWPQVRALRDAVSALISAGNNVERTLTVPPPRPLSEELPTVLVGRLVLGETQLGWAGPTAPTDGQRAVLDSLTGDAAFLDARSRLLARIDAPVSVPLGPVVKRPAQASLPSSLSLAADKLTWTLPVPTPEQRTALQALSGDRAFLVAVQRLLTALGAATGSEASVSVPMALFVPRPAQADLPAVLRARLILGTNSLQWSAPAQNEAERAALALLVRDDALNDALVTLRTQLDADRSVSMASVARRPRQEDLAAWMTPQLRLAPTEIRWTGRLHDGNWRTYLQQLPGDPPFMAAIQQLLQQLDAQLLAAPFTEPMRPTQDALGVLADKLLIGRAVLRYHGLMTQAEVVELQSILTRTADQKAAVRLFQTTQTSGMRGRELRIRARRGSAPPSALKPITPKAI